MRFGLLVLLAFAVATPAVAAPADEAQSSSQPISGTPDFLFGRPRGSFGIRGSWIVSRASSDWYQFVTDQLTLKNSDFNQPAIGTEGGVSLTSRLELVFGVDYGQSTTNSEYRRLVDNNRLPIEQTTLLRQTNISAGVKYALTERGRQISRLAWVPRSFVPYVGAGGGAMWFQVRQTGDFVDYIDFSVFTDVFEAKGWAPSAHVFGGVDIRLLRRMFLTLDGRYVWAKGDLGRTWVDFDPIDLSGFRMAAGINFVFEEAR
ncbi:MAG TPA: hypothetical protein VKB50_18950 [Vicinamibacterales bacterium]|nr:hypothetical protein [Vicinamibacterales bacterium]